MARTIGFKELIRETVLGYVFWSLYQGLPPMIWFYPMNELEITGYEAYVISAFSPLLLAIGPLRRLVQSRWILAVLRLGSVACLGCFQAPDTLQRLIILSVGLSLSLLVVSVTLWSESTYQRTVTAWGMILGLVALTVSRIWFLSFMPVWWNTTCNSIILTIAVICTVDKIKTGDDALSPNKQKNTARPNWFFTGLGFGSLLFLTHALFGEVSLICRWVVRGYPDSGPDPNPWGAAVLVALCSGLLLGIFAPSLANSIVWWIVGAASLAALFHLPSWQGFTGGLVLAVYLMTLWPEMVGKAISCPLARTLTLAIAIHVGQQFFMVWTVAYNFVPGGEYTREHTDWSLIFCAITIGLSVLTGSKKGKQITSVSIGNVTMPSSKTKLLVLLLLLAGLAGFAARQDPNRYNHPKKAHPKADFSAAIWTYHFGYDNRGWPSLERSAAMLQETGADVITLLESDASKPFLGNNDLGMWLGEKLGMYVDFGPATKDHTWGNLILSKYPFVKSEHLLLPSPKGELAPGVVATVNMTGHLVDFVVTHMGNDRDVLDRKLQAEVLAKKLKSAENPVVFLGYVTSEPYGRDYTKLTKGGNVLDIDSQDADRWCEYILYRGLIRLGYARLSHGGLSDTEVQIGKFRIPENKEKFVDNDQTVTDVNQVDTDVRFSAKFGTYRTGHNWIQEHRYHMSTPKYFIRS